MRAWKTLSDLFYRCTTALPHNNLVLRHAAGTIPSLSMWHRVKTHRKDVNMQIQKGKTNICEHNYGGTVLAELNHSKLTTDAFVKGHIKRNWKQTQICMEVRHILLYSWFSRRRARWFLKRDRTYIKSAQEVIEEILEGLLDESFDFDPRDRRLLLLDCTRKCKFIKHES